MGLPIDLFIDSPDPNLLCPICQDVLDDPTSLQCGHLFCRSCLFSYQEMRSSSPTKQGSINNNGSIVCPTCRHTAVIEIEEESSSTPPSHSVVKNIIENMQIVCKNQFEREEELRESETKESRQGETAPAPDSNEKCVECCDWKGKLCEYKSHAESTCQLELVACQAPDCNDRLMRCHTRKGSCNKPECVAGTYLTRVKADFMLLKMKNRMCMNDEDGCDKENKGSNNALTDSESVVLDGRSLLTQKSARLCVEADRILNKPFIADNNYDEMSSPPKPQATKYIHDDGLLMSPRPWMTKKKSRSKGVNKVLLEQSFSKKEKGCNTEVKTDDTTKKAIPSGLDMIKSNSSKKQIAPNEKNGNNASAAFVMAAVKILVDKEMSKIRLTNVLDPPANDGPSNGPSHDSIKAMFIHRHLIDFCRTWMQRKPDALYDCVIYRPKMDSTGSSFANINKLLCGISGPKRTGWDGGLFPIIIEWNDVDMPPKCRFPRDFHHTNVQPSGLVSISTLKDDWHPEITIPEVLFDLQQLLAHPNHGDSAQPEARISYRTGIYDYKTMIQTSLYAPTSLLEMASGIDGFGAASSWQLVDGEALSSRSGVYNPLSSTRPKEPTFVSYQGVGRNACTSYCSCCAWGQTLWDSKREMRYLFGTGCS